MHDIRFIRENPGAFDAGLARRGVAPVSAEILTLDAARRDTATRMQEAQSRRNEASKAIGKAMGQGDSATAEALKAEVAELKQTLPALEEEERHLTAELDDALARLPNLPHDDVPDGADENDNVEVSCWGTKRKFAFTPREHADIGPALGLDFETGAKISGARFTFLWSQMARLQRALGQLMLDMQTAANGFTECAVPLLVRREAVFGTGQLPKFAADLFETSLNLSEDEAWKAVSTVVSDLISQGYSFGDQDVPSVLQGAIEKMRKDWRDSDAALRWLIPTAEVSLTNAVREQIVDGPLPMRLTALTPCFRSEAGAAGRDTRGYIRQHQFEKVELVSICRPDQWEAEHAHMVRSATSILEALDLPYRKVLLCAGDMGATAKKTYDLEVWLPGQGAWREISSISWCGDYQARRMNARYRPEGQKGTAFLHTLNGSGLAVGRTLVAVLENCQNEDGSVDLPSVLHPYMGGITRLEPPK
jgi:seryl-tRNA synthetase